MRDYNHLKGDITNLRNNYREVSARALFQEMTRIMAESHDECPVEFGRLRATGIVSEPVIGDGNVSCKMGYSTKYAIWVHEILENYHKPPTKAKYLEDPVNRNLDKVPQNINARIANLLGGIT